MKREGELKGRQQLLDKHEDLVEKYRRQQEEEEEKKAREEEEAYGPEYGDEYGNGYGQEQYMQ